MRLLLHATTPKTYGAAGGYDIYTALSAGVRWKLMGETTRSDLRDGGFSRPLTTFVGRRAEADRLEDLLGGHRLVTITGPGGVGKTRLAAEVTRAQEHRFPEGIRLVELAAISDPAQMRWAVAATLGTQDSPAQSITRSIADVLSNEQSLLVLDNCEHLIAAVAEFCQVLLSSSDDTRILATSREPIGVAGEALLRLAPLPAEADPSGPDDADADGVALFFDRVRLREPAFAVTPRTRDQAAAIVARVDGLPLAIELAAARVESLGLSGLLQRLDEPLRTLATSARTTAPRHRSLQAAADWSFQLLDEQSRRSFRRLAILPGPFTLDTALAVAGPAAESAIPALIDASMIIPPREGPDGTSRYLMMETLRAYGRYQLEASGERQDAITAMNSQALLIAENAATLMQTAGGETAAAWYFDAESALLHSALLLALDDDYPVALRLGLALAPWWRLRGLRSMGYPMLSRAADQMSHSHSAEQRAADKWLGVLAIGNAAWQPALRHFTTLFDAVERQPPSPEMVDALVGRASALRNLGQLDASTTEAERGRKLAQAMGYVEGQALGLTQLILAASDNNDAAAAIRWHAQLREIETACLADEVARHVALAEAVVLADTGDLDSARLLSAQGLASARAVGDITGQTDFLYLSTHVALLSEDFADAGSHIAESLSITARSGHRRHALDCLDQCAHLCAATDRPADAVALWAVRSAQSAAGGQIDRPRDLRQREAALARAQLQLASIAGDQAERRGSAMTFQTAIELASMLAAATSSLSAERTKGGGAGLTAREEEILTLVARGHTDAQIAEMLFISIRTVRSHLDRIREKTGSRRRADLTRLALKHGLV